MNVSLQVSYKDVNCINAHTAAAVFGERCFKRMVLSQVPYKLSKALLPSAYALNLYLETGVGHS